MKTMQLKYLLNRNAVLLALHWLSDDDGLSCHATNKTIAAAARRSGFLTQQTLRELEQRGDVARFDGRDGLSGRRFVLMNHPEAEGLVRHIDETYRGKGRRARRRGV